MEPNNSQPIETNPIKQPVMQPAPPTVPAPVVAPNPTPITTPEPPKGKGSKAIILLVILLLLAVGIIIYILFAKNQMDNVQKAVTENSSTVIPTPTTVPTLTPEENLEVRSPEADLLELDADVKAL